MATFQGRPAWRKPPASFAPGNALSGAKALELGSGPFNGFDPKAKGEIPGVPDPNQPIVACLIGYAADEPGPKLRRPLEEILIQVGTLTAPP